MDRTYVVCVDVVPSSPATESIRPTNDPPPCCPVHEGFGLVGAWRCSSTRPTGSTGFLDISPWRSMKFPGARTPRWTSVDLHPALLFPGNWVAGCPLDVRLHPQPAGTAAEGSRATSVGPAPCFVPLPSLAAYLALLDRGSMDGIYSITLVTLRQ